MKTSELLRDISLELHPTDLITPPGQVPMLHRQFICHVARSMHQESRVKRILRGSGWEGDGIAFYYRTRDPDLDKLTPEIVCDSELITNTARVLWCLLTAKKYEDLGD
jgi:hypothetical protein